VTHRKIVTLIAALAAIFSIGRHAAAELIYGVAGQGPASALISWDSASPSNLQSSVFLSNLQANETILGIDFRPATGQLYALGSSNRLYTVNTATGAVSQVGSPLSTTLNGFNFGFDFNPTIDRIRVVSEVNQNLVLNPITGAVQLVATNLFYPGTDANAGVDPNVVDSAYTNNFVGATTSQLYGIDVGLDILATQANNTGVLGTVGGLGFDAAAVGGFDISGATGAAYAAILPAGSSQSSLYRINLATGAATNLGAIDGGLVVSAMTVAPVIPEPASATLLLSAVGGLRLLRRRAA
jgi:hypothetical protein